MLHQGRNGQQDGNGRQAAAKADDIDAEPNDCAAQYAEDVITEPALFRIRIGDEGRQQE